MKETDTKVRKGKRKREGRDKMRNIVIHVERQEWKRQISGRDGRRR